MSWSKIKHEVIEVGIITGYFFFCFALFMAIKMLLLMQYEIDFYGFSKALVGALVIGKVVFFIDKSPVQRMFSHMRPVSEISFKAFAYTTLVFAFVLLEKSIHFWVEAPAETWTHHIFGEGRWAMFLAHSLYIYFCFAGYFFLHFVMGEMEGETLMRRIFKVKNSEG